MTTSMVSIDGVSARINYVPLKKQYRASSTRHVVYGDTIAAAIAHLIKLSLKDRRNEKTKS